MNNWVTVKGHPVSLEIERASERGPGFISVKHWCIYRYALKRFPAPFSRFPLLHFQLAPDGWSNAIRSNSGSHVRLRSVCPRLRTDTHSSDGKVSRNSVQLLRYHPFIPPSFHPFILSLVFIHPPPCLPTCLLMAPFLQLHILSIFYPPLGSSPFTMAAETHTLFHLCPKEEEPKLISNFLSSP